jgi:TPR repeat protein
MKLFGRKTNDGEYEKCIAEARKWFEREDREKACYWYTKAGLAGRADAEMRDLGDYLVVATEYRPEMASEVARLILGRSGPIPPMYMQDVFCCALFVPDRALEQEAIRRVLSEKLNPTLCVRIADMYFEYAADRRDQVQAVLWIQRAAGADAKSFSDWAAKAYALFLLVDEDEKAKLAVLGCAQKALELAGTDPDVNVDALEDLLEALGFLEYDGSLIAKYLYEKLLANNNIALPEKHRIWQELKELQEDLKG